MIRHRNHMPTISTKDDIQSMSRKVLSRAIAVGTTPGIVCKHHLDLALGHAAQVDEGYDIQDRIRDTAKAGS